MRRRLVRCSAMLYLCFTALLLYFYTRSRRRFSTPLLRGIVFVLLFSGVCTVLYGMHFFSFFSLAALRDRDSLLWQSGEPVPGVGGKKTFRPRCAAHTHTHAACVSLCSRLLSRIACRPPAPPKTKQKKEAQNTSKRAAICREKHANNDH